DAVRLGPDDELTAVTAAQVREVIGRLIAAGHWRAGDPGHPGDLRCRVRAGPAGIPAQGSARGGGGAAGAQPGGVGALPRPPRQPGQKGRPVRHGRELKLADQATHHAPEVTTLTETARYGAATARAWHRMPPRLKARGAWAGHQGPLPVIEGTLIQLTVDHLPHNHDPEPGWLWTSRPAADLAQTNQSFPA